MISDCKQKRVKCTYGSQKTPSALCVVFRKVVAIPSKCACNLAGNFFEGGLEFLRLVEERVHPALGFEVHDTIVACIRGFGKISLSAKLVVKNQAQTMCSYVSELALA